MYYLILYTYLLNGWPTKSSDDMAIDGFCFGLCDNDQAYILIRNLISINNIIGFLFSKILNIRNFRKSILQKFPAVRYHDNKNCYLYHDKIYFFDIIELSHSYIFV